MTPKTFEIENISPRSGSEKVEIKLKNVTYEGVLIPTTCVQPCGERLLREFTGWDKLISFCAGLDGSWLGRALSSMTPKK